MLEHVERLEGLHPDLVKVVQACGAGPTHILVVEGLRNRERQKELVAAGKSRTMFSRHLTGHAVDLAPLVDGKIDWNDKAAFEALAQSMLAEAKKLDVEIIWGGGWKNFYDGPHFQLSSVRYPDEIGGGDGA